MNNATFTADGLQVVTLISQRQNPSSTVLDQCGVAFYDVQTGEKISQWVKNVDDPGHVCPGGDLYFRKNHPGHMVTDDFANSAVSEWDMQTGALLQHLPSNVGEGGPPPGTDCMSMSYDGDLVAVVRTRREVGIEYGLTIWNLQTGKTVYEVPLSQQSDPVQCVRFSPDGMHVAFVHSDRVEIYEY
jgi:WD40 repeat protein